MSVKRTFTLDELQTAMAEIRETVETGADNPTYRWMKNSPAAIMDWQVELLMAYAVEYASFILMLKAKLN